MKPIKAVFSLSFLLQLSAVTAYSAEIQLPQTGQVSCYNSAGSQVDCSDQAAFGQDGQQRSGAAWPDPRFTDNSNGTVTDNLTGLIWLQKADCFGLKSWQEALDMANGLASGACGLNDSSAPGDWRLPNTIELESLLDLGSSLPSIPAGNPFSGLQNEFFWTSTTYADAPFAAWILDFSDAFKGSYGYKSETNKFWPVRDAIASDPQHPPSVIKLPASGQTGCWVWDGVSQYITGDCAGTGQDGDKKRGVVWPVPRFADNLNGTVTDNLTGLVWLKNANCTDLGDKNWQDALDAVNNLKGDNTVCGLHDGSQQYGWRLPNRREMSSLLDHQYSSPAITPTSPFLNLPDETVPGFYWTSSTVDHEQGNGWIVDLYDGYALSDLKSNQNKIWPVRYPLPNAPPVITEGDSVPVVMSKNALPIPFSLTLHATDADNDQLDWNVPIAAASGTATVEASGGSVAVSYIPVTGFVGLDSFTVQVSDRRGGVDSISVNVTVSQAYVVHPSVTGNGTISPAVDQFLNSGASTTLYVAAGIDSYLAGVTGCGGVLTGNSYLTGSITGDCSVLADFKVTRVKVPDNAVRTDFNTLQEAYSSLSTLDNMVLKARVSVFTEELVLNRPVNVSLAGGHDSTFQPIDDFSTIEGAVIVARGAVRVDRLIIR